MADLAATGAAMRRRQRRLRAWLRHEQMTVAMALSEMKHHTSRGQKMDRAGGWVRDALHGQVPEAPTPHEPGTQHFKLDDEDSVPELGGTRPDRLVDVRPQEGTRRHGGIGYELVLATAVPQLGAQEAECALPAFLKQQKEEEEAAEVGADEGDRRESHGEDSALLG